MVFDGEIVSNFSEFSHFYLLISVENHCLVLYRVLYVYNRNSNKVQNILYNRLYVLRQLLRSAYIYSTAKRVLLYSCCCCYFYTVEEKKSERREREIADKFSLARDTQLRYISFYQRE